MEHFVFIGLVLQAMCSHFLEKWRNFFAPSHRLSGRLSWSQVGGGIKSLEQLIQLAVKGKDVTILRHNADTNATNSQVSGIVILDLFFPIS